MNEMDITAAKYLADNGDNVAIEFTVDGKTMHVSVGATGNRHYDEIMRQQSEGLLTIADAD
jgi:hypothetical protein